MEWKSYDHDDRLFLKAKDIGMKAVKAGTKHIGMKEMQNTGMKAVNGKIAYQPTPCPAHTNCIPYYHYQEKIQENSREQKKIQEHSQERNRK